MLDFMGKDDGVLQRVSAGREKMLGFCLSAISFIAVAMGQPASEWRMNRVFPELPSGAVYRLASAGENRILSVVGFTARPVIFRLVQSDFEYREPLVLSDLPSIGNMPNLFVRGNQVYVSSYRGTADSPRVVLGYGEIGTPFHLAFQERSEDRMGGFAAFEDRIFALVGRTSSENPRQTFWKVLVTSNGTNWTGTAGTFEILGVEGSARLHAASDGRLWVTMTGRNGQDQTVGRVLTSRDFGATWHFQDDVQVPDTLRTYAEWSTLSGEDHLIVTGHAMMDATHSRVVIKKYFNDGRSQQFTPEPAPNSAVNNLMSVSGNSRGWMIASGISYRDRVSQETKRWLSYVSRDFGNTWSLAELVDTPDRVSTSWSALALPDRLLTGGYERSLTPNSTDSNAVLRTYLIP